MSYLPPGAKFVVRPPDGYVWEHVWDEPKPTPDAAPPARVASPSRKRPPTPLSAAVQGHIDGKVMELVAAPVEHFVTFGLDESGNLVFEDEQSGGHYNHCDVDVKRILQKLGRKTAALVCYHNHPDGSREASAQDNDLTQRLTAALEAYDVALLKHEIVPGDVDLQESAGASWHRPELVTAWDLREREHQRLWGPVAGAYPWAPAPRRQVESGSYPRDSFDEETLVNQLAQEAMNILHSVDRATRRRVLQRVMQQLESA